MITYEIATLKTCDEIATLLGVLFAEEIEFTPEFEVQKQGVKMILEDAHLGEFCIAKEDDKVIGAVSLLYTISTALGGRVAWLEDMIIDPKKRGYGVGKGLLAFALAHAKCVGCARVTLLSDEENIKAHKMYEKMGFNRSSMIPFRHILVTK